jgi:hypothetical protein
VAKFKKHGYLLSFAMTEGLRASLYDGAATRGNRASEVHTPPHEPAAEEDAASYEEEDTPFIVRGTGVQPAADPILETPCLKRNFE